MSLVLSSILALSAAAVAAPAKKATTPKAAAGANTWAVDVKASEITWLGTKVTGKHNGTVQMKSGAVEVKNNQIMSGKVEIDMATIANTDLTDPEYNKKLVTHLKSDDFFGTEKFPVATLVVKSVTALEKAGPKGETHTVTGDMTIKGITNSISFPAKAEITDKTASATGTAVLDRTKWNVRYGSGKFFENLGDKTIHDNFEVTFKIVANKK